MTDAGEVAADIGLEYVVHLLGHDLHAQRLQSVVRVAPRPKAVTAVEENLPRGGVIVGNSIRLASGVELGDALG
jgi:hypothetical protein